MRLVFFGASIDSFALITHCLLEGLLVSSLSCYITLTNVYLLTLTSMVLIWSEIGLSSCVENQVVT